jgi:hypothetical protein
MQPPFSCHGALHAAALASKCYWIETPMKRLCRECKEPLDVDQDICRVCGANNPIPLPWYTFILGGAIVAVIVLLLVDFDDVRKVLGLQ